MAEGKTVDLGTNFPVGLCDACCARMGSGAKYGGIELPHGRTIIHVYCEHRQAGATIVVREGWPMRWSILMPVDVLDWQELLKIKAAALSAVVDEPDPALAHSAPAHLRLVQ